MAPSTPVSNWQDLRDHQDSRDRQDSRELSDVAGSAGRRGSDWQALKRDLIALLDQVDSHEAGPGTQGSRDRATSARSGGHGEMPPSGSRRVAALRSVNQAVERFNHAEQPGGPSATDVSSRTMPAHRPVNPQDELQSAIAQIRQQMQHHAAAQPDQARARHRTALAARFDGLRENDADAAGQTRFANEARHAGRARAEGAEQGQLEQFNKRFGDLAAAISGLTDRLEHIEQDVRAARGDAANVYEISAQVSQLTEVVEMLAGAVGETGQVKRLEGQIAALASAIAEGPRPEMSALSERIDDIAATVERLTDLQVQQIGRETQSRDNSDAQHYKALTAIEESVRAIYDRVDAIERHTLLDPEDFDRLTADLAEVSRAFRDGNGLRTPTEVLERIDALGQRIGEIEGKGSQIVAEELRHAIDTLRHAVVDATEPRFDALERRIEALSGEIGNRAPTSDQNSGLEALRAQIQQLAARMDETGHQLENLSTQYAARPDASQPDFEELATLVAQRTSQEIARNIGRENGLSAENLDELEARLSTLFNAGATSGRGQEIESLHRGIASVEDKIAKLEAALGKPSGKPAPKRKPAAPASEPSRAAGTPEPDGQLAKPEAAHAAPEPEQSAAQAFGKREAAAKPAPASTTSKSANLAPPPSARSDAMPHDPLADTPLRDEPFEPYELPAALAAEVDERLDEQAKAQSGTFSMAPSGSTPKPSDKARSQLDHTDLRALAAKGFGPGAQEPHAPAPEAAAESGGQPAPTLDPAKIERPSKPRSSLFAEETPSGGKKAPPPPVSAGAQEWAPSERPASGVQGAPGGNDIRADRNTFIAAARRAAMRGEATEAASSNSLIARAFSRLQGQGEHESTRAIEPKLGEPNVAAADTTTPSTHADAKTSRLSAWLERVRSKSAEAETEKEPRKGKAAKPKKARRGKTEPAGLELPGSHVGDALAAKEAAGFVPRNRRTLLLAALLVATSILAANLVLKRMTETPRAPASTDLGQISAPNPAPAVAPAAATNTFNPAPMLDPQPTGSVSPQMSIQMPGSTAGQATTSPQVMPGAMAAKTGDVAPRQVGDAAPMDAGSPASAGVDMMQTASIGDAAKTPTKIEEGPVELEMPPAQVGPLVLRQAAADGDARAQFEVAAIYTEGSIIAKDLKQAAVWYERAAAQGFAPAQYRLGNLYEHGEGVNKDLELAKLWYLRAAEAGNRMAMHNLASLLASGALGSQQFPTAAEWFGQAAARGMTDSQFNLGMLYARGLGVPQDLAQSYKWFALAARDGDKDAAQARDDIARSLDPQTLQKVKVEIANWHVAPINLAANFAPIGTWTKDFDPGAKISDTKVVKRVQIALERLGFDVGTPDGLMGPKTGQAIKKFESATGMTPSGVVNPRLLAVLGSQPV